MFERDGFFLLRTGCSAQLLEQLQNSVANIDGPGQRQFDEAGAPIDRILSEPKIESYLDCFLGVGFFRVRTIVFDKTPDANWGVPPHRDTTICVQQKVDVAGFGPWSVKAGVPHVQPPSEVLDSMVTIRVHLDDATRDTGGLLVWPGSHKMEEQVWSHEDAVQCEAKAGDVLFMRPRLVHASGKMIISGRRRIVHIELANRELPGRLDWRR